MKKIILLFAGLAFLTFINQAQTVIDYDSNVYDTVIIGTQVWMKQNLKVTHYDNGVPIPNVLNNTEWANLATGARCYYSNDSIAYDSVYGPLYNWYAVNDINNICPAGWHVSTNAEWQTAETYLGGLTIAGGKMKEAGIVHWNSPNTGATNSSGFTGLPGGMRDPTNNFQYIHENGLWWTATAYNASSAWSTYMWYLNAGVDHNPGTKKYGFSIRCVKDIGTGLGNINYIEKVKIYPNPAINKVSIEYAENQDLKMQIFNVVGECVIQGKLNNLSKAIDISSLSKGIYVIKISCVDWTMQKKLIKE
ncbi:MAG: T9SS type A sorting domain-containing protein [Bacteroidetes bacterium]|nr:T9SS type A sorting domain-containing protein [Bacteroidota bacterium]